MQNDKKICIRFVNNLRARYRGSSGIYNIRNLADEFDSFRSTKNENYYAVTIENLSINMATHLDN